MVQARVRGAAGQPFAWPACSLSPTLALPVTTHLINYHGIFNSSVAATSPAAPRHPVQCGLSCDTHCSLG